MARADWVRRMLPMKQRMDQAMARLRYEESRAELEKQTDRLIAMCRVKLLDTESIRDQARVVAGCVSREQACKAQLEEARHG